MTVPRGIFGVMRAIVFSPEPKEAELVRKKQQNQHRWNQEIPRRPVHVDSGCYRDTDQHAYEAVPHRAHNDDSRLHAVPAALAPLSYNYPVQHTD